MAHHNSLTYQLLLIPTAVLINWLLLYLRSRYVP